MKRIDRTGNCCYRHHGLIRRWPSTFALVVAVTAFVACGNEPSPTETASFSGTTVSHAAALLLEGNWVVNPSLNAGASNWQAGLKDSISGGSRNDLAQITHLPNGGPKGDGALRAEFTPAPGVVPHFWA